MTGPVLSEFGYVKSRKGDLGIEIEVEGKEPLPLLENDPIWKAKKEDSLRFHGMEYITNKPISILDKTKAIYDICKVLNKHKLVTDSPRTSIHVHKNVTKKTPKQIVTGIVAFWAVENILARMCGEDRESNLFCMRLKDAEAVLPFVIESLDAYPPLQLNDKVRYAGLNTSAINKFGSLEVRLKGGTTDHEEIDEWTTIIHDLFENAWNKYKDPADFFDSVIQEGCLATLEKLFGSSFTRKITKKVFDYVTLMEENLVIISALAYAKDWDIWEEQLTEKFKKRQMPSSLKAMKMDLGEYTLSPGGLSYLTINAQPNTVMYDDIEP